MRCFPNFILFVFFALLTSLACNAQEVIDTSYIIESDTIKNTDSISSVDYTEILKSPRKIKKEIRKQKLREREVIPRKAALYSLAVPGWGQAYNGKYWKMPIFYAAIGTSTYFLATNSRNLILYNDILESKLDPNIDDLAPSLSTAQVTLNRDGFRRNVEITGIVTASAFLWNVLDAFVDAHLNKFDVSDNLTLKLSPRFLSHNNTNIPAIGLTLQL